MKKYLHPLYSNYCTAQDYFNFVLSKDYDNYIEEMYTDIIKLESIRKQFKVGDKVTYLGYKAEITKVNKEMTGAITYNVLYDSGNGKTKVSNIFNKSNEIKFLQNG